VEDPHLKDFYAGMALVGMLLQERAFEGGIPIRAFDMAEAMMAERNRRKEESKDGD
jgi:hypothetical protein